MKGKTGRRTNARLGNRWVFPATAGLLFLLAGGFIAAWLCSSFIECPGRIQPVNRVALYAPSEGVILSETLQSGLKMEKGDEILRLDGAWPAWNLADLDGELVSLNLEIDHLQRSLELFLRHRDLEAAELYRLLDADTRLEAVSSVSRSEVLRSRFLYESFLAGAGREELEIVRKLISVRWKKEMLSHDRLLWQRRQRDCVLTAPVSGRFYSAEDLFPAGGNTPVPPPGPGRFVERGRFLGYLLPDSELAVHLRIPEKQLGRCSPGMRVLLRPVSAGVAFGYPLEGQLTRISPLAINGFAEAEVSVPARSPDSPSGADTTGNLPDLLFSSVTARIDTRLPARGAWAGTTFWEKWVLMVNPRRSSE